MNYFCSFFTIMSSIVYISDLCGICTNDFTLTDIRSVLSCGHEYHKECIDPWLSIQNTCPHCRCDLSLLILEKQVKKEDRDRIIYWSLFVYLLLIGGTILLAIITQMWIFIIILTTMEIGVSLCSLCYMLRIFIGTRH